MVGRVENRINEIMQIAIEYKQIRRLSFRNDNVIDEKLSTYIRQTMASWSMNKGVISYSSDKSPTDQLNDIAIHAGFLMGRYPPHKDKDPQALIDDFYDNHLGKINSLYNGKVQLLKKEIRIEPELLRALVSIEIRVEIYAKQFGLILENAGGIKEIKPETSDGEPEGIFEWDEGVDFSPSNLPRMFSPFSPLMMNEASALDTTPPAKIKAEYKWVVNQGNESPLATRLRKEMETKLPSSSESKDLSNKPMPGTISIKLNPTVSNGMSLIRHEGFNSTSSNPSGTFSPFKPFVIPAKSNETSEAEAAALAKAKAESERAFRRLVNQDSESPISARLRKQMEREWSPPSEPIDLFIKPMPRGSIPIKLQLIASNGTSLMEYEGVDRNEGYGLAQLFEEPQNPILSEDSDEFDLDL